MDALSMDEAKLSLKKIDALLPEAPESVIVVCTALVETMGPQLDPMGFVVVWDLAVHDYCRMHGYGNGMKLVLFSWVTAVARTIFPDDFAQEVISAKEA